MQHARSPEQAQYASSPVKNHVTSKSPVGDISVVTLIRTDTTLDHSQKAEKVWVDHRVEKQKQSKYVTRLYLMEQYHWPPSNQRNMLQPLLGAAMGAAAGLAKVPRGEGREGEK